MVMIHRESELDYDQCPNIKVIFVFISQPF